MSTTMERFGLPSGRYGAVIDGIEVGKLTDAPRGKRTQIAVRATVERNGKSVIESHPMGDGDPYDLTPSRRKGLRTMAKRLGVQDKGPAEEIVAAIEALKGLRVTARVRPTRLGDLAVTLSRNGQEPDPTPQSEPPDSLPASEPEYRKKTEAAQGAHEQLLTGLHHSHRGLHLAAEACWKLRQDDGWVALGYDSVRGYLADPDVSLSRTQFYSLADIWEQYVVKGGIPHERLVAPSKLEVPLAWLKEGKVTAEEALADADSLGLRDLRAKYRGDEEENGDKSPGTGTGKVEFPFACRACGVIAESPDEVDSDGIVYMGHRWPGGWTHEMVVAAYEAGRAVR